MTWRGALQIAERPHAIFAVILAGPASWRILVDSWPPW